MTEKHKKTILAMAQCDMNLAEAARVTYFSRRMFEYHVEAIQKETGLSAKKFCDLCRLVEMARAVP